MRAICDVCCHHCTLEEGQIGLCHARQNTAGVIDSMNYGQLTALALDPIEKKPLAMYMPGSRILSVGSYGCNLRCPFCQNWEISMAGMQPPGIPPIRVVSPKTLCETAVSLRGRGNIGVAYTYNEPLIGWEYVRDTSRLVHEAGMKNVLVSNGMAGGRILKALLPYIDAMNIDFKSFSREVYADVLGGDRDMVMQFLEETACYRKSNGECVHLEVTTLVVPGMNDSEEEIRELSSWIASLDGGRGKRIPLHITRYFPRHRMRRPATRVSTIYHLADVAREQLPYVFAGNV